MVKNKNVFIRNTVLEEAQARIERGEDPELLVHFIDDNPARGMSNGITLEEFQRGGYISRYYRLKDLANPAYWIRRKQ
jgi:hypothetical protein